MAIERVALAEVEHADRAAPRSSTRKSIIGLLLARQYLAGEYRGHRVVSRRARPRAPIACATLLAEHEMWLTVERGLAANSLAAYRRDLRRYASSSRAAASPTRARSTRRRSSRTSSTSAGSRPPTTRRSSRRRRSRAVSSRCARSTGSAPRKGCSPSDPSDQIGAPRVPQGIPKALDEPRSRRCSHAVVGDEPRAQRDRAILEVLYATGVRISELVGLDLGDIDLDDGIARVLGKGDKERVVPIGRARARGAAHLLRRRPPRAAVTAQRRAATRDAVFLNVRGGRLTRQGCWQIVRRAGERVGLADRLSPHVLRHSCATHMLDHGADIRVVQELLGHASVSTTQVYTKVSPERLRAVYESAHPRGRLAPDGRRRAIRGPAPESGLGSRGPGRLPMAEATAAISRAAEHRT